MTRVVRLRPAAEHDLTRLAKFIADSNPSAAVRLGVLLRTSALSLKNMAERGRPVREGIRELIVPFGRSRYIVRYIIDGDIVIVTRMWNSRENRPR